MTHDSVRQTPDVPMLTLHEGSEYEPDTLHDSEHVVEATRRNRWILAWETIDLEKVR